MSNEIVLATPTAVEVAPKDPLDALSPEEMKAYKAYLKKNDPPLAPRVQAELFSLYINGSTTEEIAKLNPNFSLGMVVRAKVDGLWDQRRDAHLDHLFSTVRDRVSQVQMESVVFTSDLLASANKMFGDKIKKYIQTGDEAELGTLKIDSLKQYRDAVELLLKLTGQDKKIEVKGETKTTVEFKGKLNPKEAAALLKLAE
jgi:hypothetical protein